MPLRFLFARPHRDPLGDLPVNQVSSIDDAMDQMKAIDQLLPPSDGIACFNRMYLLVSQGIEKELSGGNYYQDPVFMANLDIVFANLYFSAINAYRSRQRNRQMAWHELFARRDDPHVYEVQFAMAGMSAHIAFNLPLAVVHTCEKLGTRPTDGVHHADFEKVNALLDSLEKGVLESFLPPGDPHLDRDIAKLTAGIADFTITASRQLAWENAVTLWRLRHDHWWARISWLAMLARSVTHWIERRFVKALDTFSASVAAAMMTNIHLDGRRATT